MQVFVNGLINGLGIALLAIAFQLVYLPTKVFFIALAGLHGLAPYLYMATLSATGSSLAATTLSVGVTAAVAIGFESFNHAPLDRRGASEGAHLVSSLGIYIVIVELVAVVWGNEARTLRTGNEHVIDLAPIYLAEPQAMLAGGAIATIVAFVAMLRATAVGLKLRALADNAAHFATLGHSVRQYRALAFGLAGGLAAIASILTARDTGFSPHGGLHAVLLAVAAVIIGGRTSFAGPVAGALLIGVTRALVVWSASARWQDAVTFALLALFLLVRPQGLFQSTGHR